MVTKTKSKSTKTRIDPDALVCGDCAQMYDAARKEELSAKYRELWLEGRVVKCAICEKSSSMWRS